MSNTETIQLELDIDRYSVGWAMFEFVYKKTRTPITASYEIDSLGNFVRALSQLLDHPQKVYVLFSDEQDWGWQLSMSRKADDINFRIKKAPYDGVHFPQSFTASKSRLRYHGPWIDALRSLVNGFSAGLEQLGIDGYERQWGYDFPRDEWKHLQSAVQQTAEQ